MLKVPEAGMVQTVVVRLPSPTAERISLAAGHKAGADAVLIATALYTGVLVTDP